MSIKNTDIFGRKVFFIAPDSSLVPMSFMEDFCTLGYESHILSRGDGAMMANIDVITSHFPDAVLFIDIDANVPGVIWLQFIRHIQERNPDLVVGVVFSASHHERIQHVESEYGKAVNSLAGCVALVPGESGKISRILWPPWKKSARRDGATISARVAMSRAIFRSDWAAKCFMPVLTT